VGGTVSARSAVSAPSLGQIPVGRRGSELLPGADADPAQQPECEPEQQAHLAAERSHHPTDRVRDEQSRGIQQAHAKTRQRRRAGQTLDQDAAERRHQLRASADERLSGGEQQRIAADQRRDWQLAGC
jgi:ABC-type dipeptide/oligopeptide/nickel transport system ATPase subunit